MNLAPRLSTCSLAAGRTSVAVTTAPRRRAVAIACRPATPAPMTKTLRRRHRAGRGHHHRQRPAVFGGGVDHGAVAGEIGLARQHVHRLRAGDARQELHGEASEAGIGHGAQRGVVAVGIHDGDDDRAASCSARAPPPAAGAPSSTTSAPSSASRDDVRAGGGIVGVEDAGLDAGAGLDRDLGAEARSDLLDGFRRCGDPRLTRFDFGSNRNFHSASDGCLRARSAFKPIRSSDSRGPLAGNGDSAFSSDEEKGHQNEDDDDDREDATSPEG